MANILEDVQQYVVGKLSSDWQLSGCCQFLAESRKDIDYEIKNALGRQGIVGVCMTPKATYAGKFEDLFLAWTLEELEIDIVENVTVNRGKKNGQWMTGQQIALRVFDVLCPLSGEFEGQFSPVSIEEGEDSGLVVNKCILKALVYGEHGDVPQPEKPITYQFVKLLDQPPPLSVQPHDGWMWNDNGQLFFYVNHEAHKLGEVTQSIMSAYVESQISSKADLSDIHGDYIEDMNGNSISADRSFATVVPLSGVWQLQYGVTTNTLHGQSKTSMSYYPNEPELGDNAFQLSWGVHSDEYWTLEVYTYDGGWTQTEQHNSEAATSAATELVFPDSSVRECTYEETTTTETGKLATQGDLSSLLSICATKDELSQLSSDLSDYSLKSEVEEKLSSKADLSSLDDKRGVLDFNVYENPLSNQQTVVFNFTAAYAQNPSQPFLSAVMTHTAGEIPQWAWYGGETECKIDYFSNSGEYRFSYHNLEDGGGTPHEGQMTVPLKYPKWSAPCGDETFYFTITSQKTVLATKEDLSSKADLSAIPTKTSELSNDSGFIEQNGVAVIHDLTCDQLVANQAYIAGYATESDLSSKADLSAVPTKTSQLSNDSGYITSADIVIKRDLNDLNIYIDPMVEHTPIEVTVWHTSSISMLYTLNWDESSWYYIDDVTRIQIYFNDYTGVYVINGSIQDMGGTTHIVNASFDLTPPFWSTDFEAQYFYKINVASVKTHIVTREYVDAHLSALESDIPTKTSDLSNDSGFITSADLPVKPVPFTIKQDRSLYPTSQTITVKTSSANALSVETNPNGNGGTFVASFLISEWSSSTTLSDVVTAPDTVGCFVFKTSGQMNDTWENLKTTLISSTESFGVALPL